MARAPSAVSSAPRRERTNVSVRAPSAIRLPITVAASAPAERRTGAPFSPTISSRSAGSHSATVRAPCGDPSSVTSATVCPISSEAVAEGDAVVALAKITVGMEPEAEYRVHKPQQPAQHHRHIGAENTSVVVTFVDDDVAQIAQEHRPAGVVAQQRQVNHVGIGEDPPRSLTREAPNLARAVAVVRTRRDIAQRGNGIGQRHRGAQLVVAERLGRRQI